MFKFPDTMQNRQIRTCRDIDIDNVQVSYVIAFGLDGDRLCEII